MNLNLVCVGKIKEKYIQNGIDEFLKRMTPYGKIKILEIKEEWNNSEREVTILKECEEIEKILEKNKGYSILLDISATLLSSEEMAEKINELAVKGNSTINFIIGGSYGVTDELRKKVQMRLSFSKMTFPHQLMRLIFFEQLYRWFGINNNIKYHK